MRGSLVRGCAALACASMSLILSGCTDAGRAESAGPPRPAGGAPVPVVLARVERKPVPLQLTAIGTVEASTSVAVRAQITGELTSVNFKEGDDVVAGQVLFTLDRRPLEAALKQAEANLARDLAQATNARAQAGRSQELAARGIIAREQVESSAATASALDASVGADRAAVENATVQLQYATITAPMSGRTGALTVHPGNLVRANDTAPLVVINQFSPVDVSFGIPERRLLLLNKHLAEGSLRVEARPPGDEQHPSVGRISFVDNAVDATTGTIRIKGTFPNADRRLWPGQFVNVVAILATDPNATVVPSVAVQTGQQGTYVFVVKSDQTVEMRPVVIARTSAADAVVESGLKDGETVVIDGQLRLVPGSRITAKTETDVNKVGQ
jgi:membrane fusion protein, multidrug efflux system